MTRRSFARRFAKGAAIVSLASVPFLAIGYQLHRCFEDIIQQKSRSDSIEARLNDTEYKLDALPAAIAQLSSNDQAILLGTNNGFSALNDRISSIDPADGKYDFDNDLINFLEKGLGRIAASQYLIRTKTSFDHEGMGMDGVIGKIEIEGCCTIIAGKYAITVNHVVDNSRRLKPGMTVVSDTSYLISKDGKEIELETVIRDYENDIAVFKLPEDVEAYSFPYKIGNSDELSVGNLVYLVGNPALNGSNIREGIVSRIDPVNMLNGPIFKKENIFWISCGINPGDSGSIVLAVRDGQYELVGLPQGKSRYEERMGFAIGVSPLKKVLKSHLDKDKQLKEKHQVLYDILK